MITNKKLDDMIEKLLETIYDTPINYAKNNQGVKIERATFSLDVDQFHVIAKALTIYRDGVRAEETPHAGYLDLVEKLTDFFVKGSAV